MGFGICYFLTGKMRFGGITNKRKKLETGLLFGRNIGCEMRFGQHLGWEVGFIILHPPSVSGCDLSDAGVKIVIVLWYDFSWYLTSHHF